MGEIAEQADQSLTASRPILSRGRAVPELAAFGGNPVNESIRRGVQAMKAEACRLLIPTRSLQVTGSYTAGALYAGLFEHRFAFQLDLFGQFERISLLELR